MTNTLSKMKLKRNLTLTSVCLVLATLVVYSALRPDPEESQISEMKDIILSTKPGPNASINSLKIRDMMNKLSPETRQKLIREVMRGRLEQMRKTTASMSEKEKKEKVEEVVIRMRERFSKMTDEQRKQAQERMTSPEGKKRMNEALGFFYKEFTPQERELMTPIIDEFSIQMGQ